MHGHGKRKELSKIMKKLSIRKVLVIAPNYIVPPKYYGGTERVVDLLCSTFQKKGIKVNLIAGKGSKKYGGQLYTYSTLIPYSKNYFSRIYNRLHVIAGLIWYGRDVDVIYSFLIWPEYIGFINLFYKKKIFFHEENHVSKNLVHRIFKIFNKKNCKFIVVSDDQKKIVPIEYLNKTHIIKNPIIGYSQYQIRKSILLRSKLNIKNSPLLFIGRLTYDKGVDLAIKLALEKNKKLIILGPVKNEEKGQLRFFEEKIKPYLSSQILYLGSADNKKKLHYIRMASALIMLNRWRDPSPLTMAEATAMGCPLIGTKKGSLPENIKDGVNGFLGDSIEEWKYFLDQIDNNVIKPDICSKYSLEIFSPKKFEKEVFKLLNQ